MKYNFHSIVWLWLTILLLSCSDSQKKITFIPLNMLNYTDSTMDRGKMLIFRTDYYLIQNYKESKKTQALIDSFVENNKDVNLSNYSHYNIIFYKESSETNVKNILANRRIIDRYSQENDWIYKYDWSNGKFLSRWKIKSGEVIEPKNTITLEDIPDTPNKKE